jgi:hypothetical protein
LTRIHQKFDKEYLQFFSSIFLFDYQVHLSILLSIYLDLLPICNHIILPLHISISYRLSLSLSTSNFFFPQNRNDLYSITSIPIQTPLFSTFRHTNKTFFQSKFYKVQKEQEIDYVLIANSANARLQYTRNPTYLESPGGSRIDNDCDCLLTTFGPPLSLRTPFLQLLLQRCDLFQVQGLPRHKPFPDYR